MPRIDDFDAGFLDYLDRYTHTHRSTQREQPPTPQYIQLNSHHGFGCEAPMNGSWCRQPILYVRRECYENDHIVLERLERLAMNNQCNENSPQPLPRCLCQSCFEHLEFENYFIDRIKPPKRQFNKPAYETNFLKYCKREREIINQLTQKRRK
jgi:hypothetical protein